MLKALENVSDPAAIDDRGNLYLMDSREPYPDDPLPALASYHTANDSYGRYSYSDLNVSLSDYRVPASIVDSCDKDGNMLWRVFTIDQVSRQDADIGCLPLYNNGTIYVPMGSAYMAIDRNGSQKWTTRLDPADYPFEPSYMKNGKPVDGTPYSPERPSDGNFRVYERMPFDSAGNLYVLDVSDNPFWENSLPYLIVIGPDGNVLSHQRTNTQMYVAAGDGIGYRYGTPDGLPYDGNRGLGRLSSPNWTIWAIRR